MSIKRVLITVSTNQFYFSIDLFLANEDSVEDCDILSSIERFSFTPVKYLASEVFGYPKRIFVENKECNGRTVVK